LTTSNLVIIVQIEEINRSFYMKAPDEKNLVVAVPGTLHKKLKVYAAENSTTVSAIVRKALTDSGFTIEDENTIKPDDEKSNPLEKSL
jgi:hypothetical protein